MSYNELQYWRTRTERLEAELAQARNDALEEAARVAEARDLSIMSMTVVDVEARKIAAAIRTMKTKPAMDADTARAWRESDGDHRGHVEDRNDAVRAAKLPFPLGVRVRKKSGSQWQGRVVGYYSASRTLNGIAVESEREIGNVQVYPAEAFELVPEDNQ